jgi:hypothetical protein
MLKKLVGKSDKAVKFSTLGYTSKDVGLQGNFENYYSIWLGNNS